MHCLDDSAQIDPTLAERKFDHHLENDSVALPASMGWPSIRMRIRGARIGAARFHRRVKAGERCGGESAGLQTQRDWLKFRDARWSVSTFASVSRPKDSCRTGRLRDHGHNTGVVHTAPHTAGGFPHRRQYGLDATQQPTEKGILRNWSARVHRQARLGRERSHHRTGEEAGRSALFIPRKRAFVSALLALP